MSILYFFILCKIDEISFPVNIHYFSIYYLPNLNRAFEKSIIKNVPKNIRLTFNPPFEQIFSDITKK